MGDGKVYLEPESCQFQPPGQGGTVDRSREVPLKDYSEGEHYTKEEIKFLKERWNKEDIEEVAKWFDVGTPREQIPESVKAVERKLAIFETTVFDLRGINLQRKLKRDRRKDDPEINLTLARLEYANLRGTNLEYAHLSGIHLEYAGLALARLQHANLHGAYFERANLSETHLEHANLSETNLQYANLSEANLHCACLCEAQLEHAGLRLAHIEHACLCYAHLEYADLSKATVSCADFSNVYLDNTIFRDVKWEGKGQDRPNDDKFKNFDVRGIRFSDPLFDQCVRQLEFIRRIREKLPKQWLWLFWVWEQTCDCGRSIWRWLATCGFVVGFFFALFLVTSLVGYPLVKPNQGTVATWFSEVYFSVVTFSTLGFGDVLPCNVCGQVAVVIEVFLGYVCLGGLISIFTTKFIPPR